MVTNVVSVSLFEYLCFQTSKQDPKMNEVDEWVVVDEEQEERKPAMTARKELKSQAPEEDKIFPSVLLQQKKQEHVVRFAWGDQRDLSRELYKKQIETGSLVF
eukprot:m.133969 g.133969  ORF g.133969 m.133969 type:complete len:103 (+) comp14682_c1_seq10:827-1135(+)